MSDISWEDVIERLPKILEETYSPPGRPIAIKMNKAWSEKHLQTNDDGSLSLIMMVPLSPTGIPILWDDTIESYELEYAKETKGETK